MPFFDFQLAGYWNASNNDRGLKSGKGQRGQLYLVTVAGSTTLDGITDWYVGDSAWFDDNVWRVIPGPNRPAPLPNIVATDSITARSLQNRFAERINVKDFGAIADGAAHPLSERFGTLGAAQAIYSFVTSLAQQIDWAAAQLAFNTAATLKTKEVYFPGADYNFGSDTVSIKSFIPSTSSNTRIPVIQGDGKNHTTILVTGANYAFTLSEEAHFLRICGIQVFTTTGGFVTITNTFGVCGVELHDIFLNGCGTGFWALNSPGASSYLFPVTITDSHFRHTGSEYKGGVVYCANSLGFTMGAGNFITRMVKDGPIIHLKNATAAHIGHFQIEGTAGNLGAPPSTNQAMIYLEGSCFDITVETIWLEGNWDYLVLVASGSVTIDLQVRSIFAWQYAAAEGGKTSPEVVNFAFSPSSRRGRVTGLCYKNDNTGAGTGYIINDPYQTCFIEGFENQSGNANQQARMLSQRYASFNRLGAAVSTVIAGVREFETNVGGYTNPDAGGGGATNFNINLANDPNISADNALYEGGVYEVWFVIRSADKIHKIRCGRRVTYDRVAAPNNYANVETIGTDVPLNAAPTVGAVTVSRDGRMTIPCTQNGAIAQSHSISWSWKRTASLGS